MFHIFTIFLLSVILSGKDRSLFQVEHLRFHGGFFCLFLSLINLRSGLFLKYYLERKWK